MPIELVRALLTGQWLSRDMQTTWRFYGDPGREAAGVVPPSRAR